MRLANRARINWTTAIPPAVPDIPSLEGDLLRFIEPAPAESAEPLDDALE